MEIWAKDPNWEKSFAFWVAENSASDFASPFLSCVGGGREEAKGTLNSLLAAELCNCTGKTLAQNWNPMCARKPGLILSIYFVFLFDKQNLLQPKRFFYLKSATIFPTWYLVGSLSSFFPTKDRREREKKEGRKEVAKVQRKKEEEKKRGNFQRCIRRKRGKNLWTFFVLPDNLEEQARAKNSAVPQSKWRKAKIVLVNLEWGFWSPTLEERESIKSLPPSPPRPITQ